MEKQTKMDTSWEKIKQKLKEPAEETQKEEYPEIWDWKTNPELIGTIERIRPVTTVYGETLICDLRKTDNTLTSFWITTVLRSRFDRLGIKEGYRVGIKCLGKRDKKRYYDFKVVVE